MNKLIRFWNQNRKEIIIIIGLIVFIILIIQTLNYIAGINKENESSKIQSQSESNKEDLPITSIITGENVSIEVTQENKNLIDEFVKYCNEKEITNAYNLLTDECKKILFSTEQEFIDYYYSIIFTETKLVNIENFKNSSSTYTYVVQYYNDVLADGKISDSDIYKDYITIDKRTNKININSFISSKEINKTSEYGGIAIEVKEQQIYKDYEKYIVAVENSTDKTILLDTRSNSRSMYVLGDNNTKYSAFANEILDTMYEIPSYYTKTYTIKYDKIYDPDNVSRKLGFTDIVTDFESYHADSASVNKRTKIIVSW